MRATTWRGGGVCVTGSFYNSGSLGPPYFDATTLLFANLSTEVALSSAQILEGTGSINLGNMSTSNNIYQTITGTGGSTLATLEVAASISAASELCFHVESSVDMTGIQQRIELFNGVTDAWVEFDKRPATLGDRTIHVMVRNDPSAYIENGTVKARIHFDDVGIPYEAPVISIDLAKFAYTQ